jgi:hypothetical protein
MSSSKTANTIIKIDQQFDTPCSNQIRDAFDRVKTMLQKEGVKGIDQMFAPIEKALAILQEKEQHINRQEYAIRLQIYYEKMQKAQNENYDNVSNLVKIEKDIADFEEKTKDFLADRNNIYALKHTLIENLKQRGINFAFLFQ